MAKPLNVLLITTDQQRKDHMGCSGNPVLRTPHTDRIAREGVYLDRAYVANPVCMPNRASILTGRLPRNHGCWCNGIELPEDNPMLSALLAARGYRTALLGKAHFRPFSPPWEGPPRGQECGPAWEQGLNDESWCGPYYGFEYVQLCMSHAHTTVKRAHHGAWVKKHLPEVAARKIEIADSPLGSLQCGTPNYPPEAHSSHWVGEIARTYLHERAADKDPFFLWASFPDPHHPFIVPEPYASMYDPKEVVLPKFGKEVLDGRPRAWRRFYEGMNNRLSAMTEPQLREIIARTYGMVSFIDDNVGKLLQALDDGGLAEDTIVIYTTDHGELMGDAGLLLKGAFLAEGLVNVPMLWRVPKRSGGQAGARSAGLFSSCDIAPTVLELLGGAIPRAMDGIAQAELVKGGDGKRTHCPIEFRENPRVQEAPHVAALVTPDRKLVHWPAREDGVEEGELYDMTAAVPDAKNLYFDPAWQAERQRLTRMLLDQTLRAHSNGIWPISGA